MLAGATAATAIPAIRCAKHRSYLGYLGYIAALTVGAILWSFATVPSSDHTVRQLTAVAVTFLPLGGTYAVVPGLLALRMASPKAIVISTLLVTAIALPCWFVFSLYVSCHMGYGCI